MLAQVAATMAAPWLVGVAIDDSLPDARRGHYTSLAVVGVAAAGRRAAVRLAALGVRHAQRGASARTILYDLRRRGFDHMQALSVAFHERFTSGRVISRLTSDVDTLTELLDSGLDGLLTALFNSAAIAVLLVVLDLPLGRHRARLADPAVAAVPLVLAARRGRLPAAPARRSRR